MALATLLHNLEAEGPRPPVVSKANGQYDQSPRRQEAEFVVFLADLATEAVAVASSRVAWDPEMRNPGRPRVRTNDENTRLETSK